MLRIKTSVTTLLVGLALTACVGPARTQWSFDKKAKTTAEQELSAVETVRLAVDVSSKHDATTPYIAVLVADSEKIGEAVASSFDSIQPPGKKADDLRDQLDDLLTQATSTLSDVRIAARRNDVEDMTQYASALNDISSKLSDFADAADQAAQHEKRPL